MILKKQIEKIASVKAKELNGCIVDITISSGNDIVVYFDKIGGVHIKECVTISKSINDFFDRDIEDYSLTVCSAGLESPFKVENQYKKNIGKEVKVLLTDGKRCTLKANYSDIRLTIIFKGSSLYLILKY